TMAALVREGPGHETAAPATTRHSTSGAFVRLVTSQFAFLLGIYIVGRFFLLFVAARLGLDTDHAARQAGMLLAALTLATAGSALLLSVAAIATATSILPLRGLSARGAFRLSTVAGS